MHTIVGVLQGGPSDQHGESMTTGRAILEGLPDDRFVARPIYIDKQGTWYDRGRAVEPGRVLRQIDAALVGLHGRYGEDGDVQKILKRYGVPFAGSDAFGSYLAWHKPLSKMHAQQELLKTPRYTLIEQPGDVPRIAQEVVRTLSQPVVIKPVGASAVSRVSIAGGYAQIVAAAEAFFAQGAHHVLIEEFVRGREVSVGVVEGIRGEKLYALPAIEIATDPSGDLRTLATARKTVPAYLSRVEAEELARMARRMHHALGLRHYSQSDFIVSSNGIYYLETDTLPPLGEGALMARSLESVGIRPKDFFTHLVKLALSR